LIDQHAASERVRVECFLKKICLGFLQAEGIRRVELVPPKPVLLTRREVEILETKKSAKGILTRWGFSFVSRPTMYDEGKGEGSEDRNTMYGQVQVDSVPEVISEKVSILDVPILFFKISATFSNTATFWG